MARNIWKSDRYQRKDGLGYDYPGSGIYRKQVEGILEAKSKSGTGFKIGGQWYNLSKFANSFWVDDRAEWGDYVTLGIDDSGFVRTVTVLEKWHQRKSKTGGR